MTALRMAQSQDMWQKSGPTSASSSTTKPQAEATSVREPTPPPAASSGNGSSNAPHMPHGLTVQVGLMYCATSIPIAFADMEWALQELKELTRMRLAREKLTQEEVSKVQVARDALTAYRQSLYPDSEDNNGPMTDDQMFTMLQEMDPQNQKESTLPDEQVVQEMAKAGPSPTTTKDKTLQGSLFSLRRRVRAAKCRVTLREMLPYCTVYQACTSGVILTSFFFLCYGPVYLPVCLLAY